MGTLLEGGRLELRNEPEVATPPARGDLGHFVATDGPAVPLPRCQARELGEARTGLTASQPVSPLSPLEREPRCAVRADLQLHTPRERGGPHTRRGSEDRTEDPRSSTPYNEEQEAGGTRGPRYAEDRRSALRTHIETLS